MSDLDPTLLQDFLTESAELIDQLDQDLVSLEAADAADQSGICNSAFRALHTIKGAAGFLGLTAVTEFAHAAEDALNKLRKGEVAVTPAVMDLLLRSADVVRGQIDQLSNGETPDKADPALIDQLHAVANGTLGQTPTPASNKPHADAEEQSDEASGTPGRPLKLGPQKLDLLEFMVTDLKDYVSQLDDAVMGLANDGTRGDAAHSIAEIADNLVKTADFFELDDLTALTKLLHEVAPRLENIEHSLVDEAVVRVKACQKLIDQQAEALGNLRALDWNLDTFNKHLREVSENKALDAGYMGKHGGDVATLLALEGVCGTTLAVSDSTSSPEEDATVLGKIAPPSQPAAIKPSPSPSPAANNDVDAEDDDRRTGEDRRVNGDRRQGAANSNAAPVAEQTIRVEVGRLEALLNLVGQLVLNKNRLVALSRDLREHISEHNLAESYTEAAGELDRLMSELQVGVMRTRMQPLAKLFDRYPRVIRDIARATSKKIDLDIVGKDTEVDKSVLELLADPLVHILRNSADHGIESPEDRVGKGKPETGTVRLSAEHQGSHVRVAISDDGKGLHRDVLGAKAIEKGLTTPDALEKMSDSEVFRFIFEAGFSTAKQVSDLSGRGVGMDVVRTNINKLNGTINIASEKNRGTTIEILIPLTVAIMPAMVVESAGEQYAIPLQCILEIVRPEDNAISSVQGQRVVRIRDSVLPLADLRDRLHQPPKPPHTRFAVVVKVGGTLAGLVVDRLIGQQEIVIKPLDDAYTKGGPFSGATIREDGRVCLILDVVELLKHAHATAIHAEKAA